MAASGWYDKRQLRLIWAMRSSRQNQRLRQTVAWATKYIGTPRFKASSSAYESFKRALYSSVSAPSSRPSCSVLSSTPWAWAGPTVCKHRASTSQP